MKCKSCGRKDINNSRCDYCGELDGNGYPTQTKARADEPYLIQEPYEKKDETITTEEDIKERIDKAVGKTKGFIIGASIAMLIGIITILSLGSIDAEFLINDGMDDYLNFDNNVYYDEDYDEDYVENYDEYNE